LLKTAAPLELKEQQGKGLLIGRMLGVVPASIPAMIAIAKIAAMPMASRVRDVRKVNRACGLGNPIA
jgi:hypothetical protein